MSIQLPELPLHEAGFIFAVLAATILIGPLIAKRLRLPDVVIMVLLGFAIGPTGFGLIDRAGAVEVLGGAGLLYLMFVAGLELDLDDFVKQRGRAIGFGTALFAIPMVLGTFAALWLGFSWLAALLIGSCWSSHTLLTYPIFQRSGAVSNRAVTTSVGATIVTDTAALLVLAVIARAAEGQLGPLFWATLIPSTLLLTSAALFGLPRLTRRFFSGEGQDRNLRFLFVFTMLFVIAALYEIIGIESIVGAFLAGLALNRSVPNSGALMEWIEFLGTSLFIPLFLIATGMLIDLRVLIDPWTLVLGGAFTAVAMGGRALASGVAGRIFGWDRTEILTMFALTAPQAAATLAVLTVGLNVGLIGTATVNASMLVILLSCVLASAIASSVAPKLPQPPSDRDLGEVVVVPLANPATAPRLMRLASAFARADGGLVIPLMVASYDADEELERMRSLESDVIEVAQSEGAEARAVLRIDASPQTGIAHTIREHQGSLLVLGWKGATATRGSRFGGITDEVLARTNVPTLLSYEGSGELERVLVIIDHSVATPTPTEPLFLALATARNVARDRGLPIEVITNADHPQVKLLVEEEIDEPPRVDGRARAVIVRDQSQPTDLIVLPALRDDAHLRLVPGRLLKAVPRGAGLLIAISDAAPLDRGEVELSENHAAPGTQERHVR